MIDRIHCEFSLIRYVPDLVRGEFVNIGIFLRQITGPFGGEPTSAIRFTRDWTRVVAMHPDADLEMLEALEEDFSGRIVEESCTSPASDTRDTLIKLMSDSFSGLLQVSEPQPALAESLALETDLLMELYVETAHLNQPTVD